MKKLNLKDMDNLPMDVMGVIYEFIPSNICRKITKEKYILHYSSLDVTFILLEM